MMTVNDDSSPRASDMRIRLQRQGLDDRHDVLAENDIDIGLLEELTETDPHETGVSIGQRCRFFRAPEQDPPIPRMAPSQPDPGTPAEPIAERRQMTVMVRDPVGPTEIAAGSTPRRQANSCSALPSGSRARSSRMAVTPQNSSAMGCSPISAGRGRTRTPPQRQ